MDGLLQFCFLPISHRNDSILANASFTVWDGRDFGPCFEYLFIILASNSAFAVASAVYAGLKCTRLKRKTVPLPLVARAFVCMLMIVLTVGELVGSFKYATERPLVVFVAEFVSMAAWSLHMLCVLAMGFSVRHSGRGPLGLHAVWYLTLVASVFHCRTTLSYEWDRWRHDESSADYSSFPNSVYFEEVILVSSWLRMLLQLLYLFTLVFYVAPVKGSEVDIPNRHQGLLELESFRQEEEVITFGTGRRRMYGSILSHHHHHHHHSTISSTRYTSSELEASSEDSSNVLSYLSFWWVQPIMRKGEVGKLERPNDLPLLPRALRTSRVRERFQAAAAAATACNGSGTHPAARIESSTASEDDTTDQEAHLLIDTQPGEKAKGSTKKESGTASILYCRGGGKAAAGNGPSTDPQEVRDKSDTIEGGGDLVGSQCHRHKGAMASSSPPPLLVKSLNKAFGLHYYPLGLLKLASDLLSFAGPLLLHALVSFMENATEPIVHGYLYALGLFLSTLLGAFFITHFNYQVTKVGLKVRGALITEIYRKALSVNLTTLSHFSTGQIVNFMSTDTDRIVNFCQSFHQFWSLPFQVTISLYLLYQQVGVAFLSGVAFCVLLVPINRWLAVKIAKYSKEMMHQKDNRVKLMNEILTGIRVIKLYVWEAIFSQKVQKIRSEELVSLKWRKYLDALCVYFWATTPILISLLTFTTYAALGHTLTAAKVFTSVSLFAILIGPLNAFPWVINGMVEAWVSVKRVQEFLSLEELDLGSFYVNKSDLREEGKKEGEAREASSLSSSGMRDGATASSVVVAHGSFGWRDGGGGGGGGGGGEMEGGERGEGMGEGGRDVEEKGEEEGEGEGEEGEEREREAEVNNGSPSRQEIVLSDINFTIKKGQFVGVVGKVGSGKSSLLAAITAEMKKYCGQVYVADLSEGFGLTTQKCWIQQGTIRQNILFGMPYIENKYWKVIAACALEHDLEVLPAGDRTEVGENGVTLSGGQKARLALARAVYQDKDIYLLDDPIAAVDAHVASHIYTHCITGLLRHKTRVLCTHHRRFLWQADVVMAMEGGRVARSGPPGEILPLIGDVDGDGGREGGGGEEGEGKGGEEGEGEGEGGGGEGRGDESEGVMRRKECVSDERNLEIVVAESDGKAEMERGGRGRGGADSDGEGEGVLVMEEEKEVGVVAYHVYSSYWRAVGLVLTPTILLAILLMQASRNFSDWWLAYWISHEGNMTAAAWSNVTPSTPLPSPFPFPSPSPLPSSSPLLSSRSIAAFISSGTELIMSENDSLSDGGLGFYLGVYGALGAANSVFAFFRAFLYAYGGICAASLVHRKLLWTVIRAPVSFFDVTPIGRLLNRFSSDTYAIDDTLPFILNIFLAQLYGLLGSLVVTCFGLPLLTVTLPLLAILYYKIQHFYRLTSRELKRLSTVTLSPIYAHFSETLAGLWTIRALRASDQFIRENERRLEVNQRANYGTYAVAQWLGIRLQMIGVFIVAAVAFIAMMEHHLHYVNPGLVGLAISYALSVTALLSGVVTSFTETEKEMVSVERVMQYVHGIWPEAIGIGIGNGIGIGIGTNSSSCRQAKAPRSGLAIIPQDPFLFSGSIRENLDPCSKYSDDELWSALTKCHLHDSLINTGGLDTMVGEKECVLSTGQRQLLCLARALLTKAKVVCVDEATANVDLETDRKIQRTVRAELASSTVITVAHRIGTVLDSDRIIVMESGHIREMDSPTQLLANPTSLFSLLYGEQSSTCTSSQN